MRAGLKKSSAVRLVLMNVGGSLSVIAVTIDGGRIIALDVMRNPDKLTTVKLQT